MSAPLSPAARRSALISALRHPETWPAGFEWEFAKCQKCAIGLFKQLFDRKLALDHGVDAMNEPLGLMAEQSAILFCTSAYGHPDNTTPAMVADRLETLHRELCAKETPDNVDGHNG